jgi:predicted transcriptional regulator
MSTIELKNKLKEKIEELNEDYILEHLISIIELETSDSVIDIPESHINSIEIGLAQAKAGNTISNEDVLKSVQKWSEK